MKKYLVGGAVRDELMGVTPKDLDYVVVGSTPEEMLSLGYKQVGKDFPVFLHPETKDEYALARTEKSTGDKYQDFDCYFGKDVTLEDDLFRRDLTINAIAKDLDTGEYIDPFNGMEDIKNKVLRQVSKHFVDDPVRVLRLHRFQATLGGDWTIYRTTLGNTNCMRMAGMLDDITPERIWIEMEKALKGTKPSRFFHGMARNNLLPELLRCMFTPQNEEHHPEGDVKTHTDMVVDYAAKHYCSEVVFAGLCHDFGKPVSYKATGNALEHEIKGLPVIEEFCKRLKVPNVYRDLALMTCEYHTKVHGCLGRGSNAAMRPKSVMKLFTDTNALAKPERFTKFLQACESDAKGRGGDYPNKPYQQKDYLLRCLKAATDVDTKEAAKAAVKKGKSGIEIGEAIRVARIDVIRGVKRNG